MKKILMAPWHFLILLIQSVTLALSQIWANKTRSVLTTLGIIIGVASVTSVIAALSGLKSQVLKDIETMAGTNNIYINPHWPDHGPMRRASWRIIRFKPYQFEGLIDHCPSIEKFTLNSWGGEHTVKFEENSLDGVRMYGVEPAWHEIDNRHVILGRPISIIDNEQARNVCLIDESMIDKLRLDKDCIGDIITVSALRFMIIGVLELKPQTSIIGGNRGDRPSVHIPFRTSLRNDPHSWIWSIASTKSTNLNDDAIAELRFFLRYMREIKPGEPDTFRIQSVQSEISEFKKISMVITMITGGVVSISLIVGGVGIMNIMLVSVSERTREIGLRKAVGARSSAILTQFLVEAVVLCLTGGFIGIGFGFLFTEILTNIPNAKLDHAFIPAWAILLSFGFSAVVGVFFGMFPAVKAARLNPIEALRHE